MEAWDLEIAGILKVGIELHLQSNELGAELQRNFSESWIMHLQNTDPDFAVLLGIQV